MRTRGGGRREWKGREGMREGNENREVPKLVGCGGVSII
jgi:hypothetical protein